MQPKNSCSRFRDYRLVHHKDFLFGLCVVALDPTLITSDGPDLLTELLADLDALLLLLHGEFAKQKLLLALPACPLPHCAPFVNDRSSLRTF